MVHQNWRVLLLVDNAPLHCHSPSNYPNIRIKSLAPNLTTWIQLMDAGVIWCFKAHYWNEFTQLALQRDNEGVDKIYHIDQLAGMRLASSAWKTVTPATIANCWRHTRLAPLEAPDTNTQALKEEEAANRRADALRSKAETHPRMMELEFQQMMAALTISHPTERELTEEEIAGKVLLSFKN
ncbi:tigger transposable element-derived protein 4 [Ceratobasidium sp. AG-Ba]|nr:tigger transposable element-derived protein 4 [Ceratobasidium sp. AG-Ba]